MGTKNEKQSWGMIIALFVVIALIIVAAIYGPKYLVFLIVIVILMKIGKAIFG